MEPLKSEKPVESRGESLTSLPRKGERKRRFQIVKLEERIAPIIDKHTYGCGHRNLTLNGVCK